MNEKAVVIRTPDRVTLRRGDPDRIRIRRGDRVVVVDGQEMPATAVSGGIDVTTYLTGPKGPQGAPGDPGAPGQPGPGAEGYIHFQANPVEEWGPIVHNLGKSPVFLVEDSAGTPIAGGTPRYLNSNEMTITFALPFAGKAYLS